MNNLERVQNSLNFIENNLEENITLQQIAESAFFSRYHFHRMFSAVTGYTVKTYIRKRRLAKAAADILNTDNSLINTALKYQFESQQSFSVAFKKMHGMNPGIMRKEKMKFQSFDKIIIKTQEISKPKGVKMEPEKTNLNAFSAVGMICHTKQSEILSDKDPVKQLWVDFKKELKSIANRIDENSILVVYEYDPQDMDKEDISYSYMVCVKVKDLSEIPRYMVGKTIPESKYLVFEHDKSKGKLYETYDYIDDNYIPQSDYEFSENPDFEVHNTGKDGDKNLIKLYVSIK